MLATDENDLATERLRELFTRYSEALLRDVASLLVKPRAVIPADELVEKCLGTLLNPPVMDRRLKELPDAARKALTLMGLSRRTTWNVGSLVLALAALGHAEGFPPSRRCSTTASSARPWANSRPNSPRGKRSSARATSPTPASSSTRKSPPALGPKI